MLFVCLSSYKAYMNRAKDSNEKWKNGLAAAGRMLLNHQLIWVWREDDYMTGTKKCQRQVL